VPAAAVIPALIACIKIAAVKTLVVAPQRLVGRSTFLSAYWTRLAFNILVASGAVHSVPLDDQGPYLEKIRVFKAGLSPEYISME